MADNRKIEKKEQGQKVERLENRLMINYAVVVGAYVLWNYLNNMITGAETKYNVTIILAILSVIGGVVCYLFHKKTKKTKNFGHMFIVLALALIYTKASMFVYKIFGGHVFNTLNSSAFLQKFLFNSANAVKIIGVLGIIWVVFITIFTLIQIGKENNKKKNGKK